MPSKNTKTSSVKNTSTRWWNEDIDCEGALAGMKSMKSKMTTLPKDVGVLRMFESEFGVKLCDAKLMSVVDENKKLCISLTDAQYDFLKKVEDQLRGTLIAKVKLCEPKYEESEFTSCVRVSETTGQKYIKTKVQLLGRSRTYGVDLDGSTCVNPLESFTAVGTSMDVRIRVDGVYLTKERAGLVTKVDLFKIKSIPSEEDIEEAREKKRARMDAEREEEMRNF